MRIKLAKEFDIDVAFFNDFNGQDCSIQKSSLAREECIWLGVRDQRMHLTKEMVEELMPYLRRFIRTGEISDAFVPFKKKISDNVLEKESIRNSGFKQRNILSQNIGIM